MFATDMRAIASNSGQCARLVAVVLLLALLGGCTKQAACSLQNNSGSDLTVVRSRPGDQEQRVELKAGSSMLLRDWLFWSYSVVSGGKSMRYLPQDPGSDFVFSEGFGPWAKRIFNAQIEPDGRIFLLKPGQTSPVKDFVNQPPGFPLVPAAG